jgi:choline dehydrogenase-like flavoprotein
MPDQLIKNLFNMTISAPSMAKFVCWYLFGWDKMISRRELNIELEQFPNPESRVTLSTECDPLGLRKVRLDWRVTDLDRHTIRRTAEIIAAETASSDIVTFTPYESALNGEWMNKPNRVGHHMGTTRMGSNKLDSVVDANLRVHELDNLYIAGSSVFPCAPVQAPTLTILALAHRLADHLKREFSRYNPYQGNAE